MQHFLGETLTLAVLNSCCTKIACGEEWLQYYAESLCDDDDKRNKRV